MIAPVPIALVRTSASPGRAVELRTMRRTSIFPVTDRPYRAPGPAPCDLPPAPPPPPRLGSSSLQDGGEHRAIDAAAGEAADVQSGQGDAPHGIDIGKGIRGRDLPEDFGVVHHGRDEVDRLDEGRVTLETVDSRVIGSPESTRRFGSVQSFHDRSSPPTELCRSASRGGELDESCVAHPQGSMLPEKALPRKS